MFLAVFTTVCIYIGSPLWPPYSYHQTRNWVDQKTFQIHPFSYFPLIESKIQINSISLLKCVFIAFLTSASEGLNVFIHVVKVVVNLLHLKQFLIRFVNITVNKHSYSYYDKDNNIKLDPKKLTIQKRWYRWRHE